MEKITCLKSQNERVRWVVQKYKTKELSVVSVLETKIHDTVFCSTK